ncbi:MAG: hypothetical protein AW09_002317 [Candidatus Accumulibacter phosphatis]|jgi:hypothetical protein|uniref:Uncharacterized protein n=1 Tax=Candidatus Accumulibacter phosphatis TaxID=327160 RepID=A0A080LV65_9PROT|nr:MAG: hypothetical protein AW09_002317 [Candidatus Accumulibacter phosphatis]
MATHFASLARQVVGSDRGQIPADPLTPNRDLLAFRPITTQTFRDGVPHETKAYAIAKSAHHFKFVKRK